MNANWVFLSIILLAIGLGIFFLIWKEKKKEKKPEIKIVKDIKYGNDNKYQLMDLYTPNNEKDGKRCVVFVHGGGMVGGSKTNLREVDMAITLVKRGFAVFNLDYIVGKGAYNQNMLDVEKAVKYIIDNDKKYGIDSDNISLMGVSAGSTLMSLTAVKLLPTKLKNIIYFYGISNPLERIYTEDKLLKSGKKKEEGEFRTGHMLEVLNIKKCISCKDSNALPRDERFCNEPERKFHCMHKLWKEVSLVDYLLETKSKVPHFIIIHGTNDNIVDFNQAKLLEDALKKTNNSVSLIPVEGGKHGFSFFKHKDGSEISVKNLDEKIINEMK